MRLFVFKRVPRTDNIGIIENRWSFHMSWNHIGFQHEAVCLNGKCFPTNWYELNITKHWHWGRSMIWYDGPHNSFSVGPCHFNYRDWSQSPEDETE